MKSVQDIILDALKNSPTKAAAPESKSKIIQTALARIKERDKLSKWKFALKTALQKGDYSFTQISAMIGKFETAVKKSGNYEKCFLECVENFGNSDPRQELAIAKKSFL